MTCRSTSFTLDSHSTTNHYLGRLTHSLCNQITLNSLRGISLKVILTAIHIILEHNQLSIHSHLHSCQWINANGTTFQLFQNWVFRMPLQFALKGVNIRAQKIIITKRHQHIRINRKKQAGHNYHHGLYMLDKHTTLQCNELLCVISLLWLDDCWRSSMTSAPWESVKVHVYGVLAWKGQQLWPYHGTTPHLVCENS